MSTDRLWTLVARKLARECSTDELLELSSLMAENSDWHLQIQLIMTSWQGNDKLNRQDLEASYQNHLTRLKESGFELHAVENDNAEYIELTEHRKFPKFRKLKLILAVATILTVIVIISIQQFTKGVKTSNPVAENTNNVISTKHGSRSKIELPDGSTVWLNAGSTLTYNKQFDNQLREVFLNGEAYFDVVKNAEKPFIVHTTITDIKVLGTAFNVRSYATDETVETSLIRGSVEVTLRKRPGEKWLLKPNEKLVLLNDNRLPSRQPSEKKETVRTPLIAKKELTYQPGDSIAVEIAWTKNKLSFEDETFEEVAIKLERWYDVEFEFRNPKLKEVTLHNSFTNETLEQVLDALEFSLNFKHRIMGKKVIIY